MIEKSDYVFVVADSSKFQEKGLYTVCSWEEIDGIITDHASQQSVWRFKSKGFCLYWKTRIKIFQNKSDFFKIFENKL